MTDHNELAARIERAEGPDRALDAEIAVAVGWRVLYDKSDPNDAEPYYQPVPEMSWRAVPHCTASIDAAMQLVPNGWKLRQMHFNAPCADDRKWHLNLRGGKEGEDRFVGRGSTPALALCAAAIRARSAS